MISRNLIYFHLLIDFSLSSFLMKKNHRFSSLPKTFSIQFSTLHPLDHHLCMILPSESSPLPPTKHLLCFYLNSLAELLFFSGSSCCNFFSPVHITTSEYMQKSADILVQILVLALVASLFLSLIPFSFTDSALPILYFPAIHVLYLLVPHLPTSFSYMQSMPVSSLPLLAPTCYPT